ncbi:hypothetical protein BD289DRAFT_221304 [Coniella lustricola]|uniref:Uncharacterized protein n=1 Tax=Coniella lustricola TaxID=2025994 RepID=A0A2T3ALV2_9PEZI|nr:hypothetical protein BD289DRAFT_221304 [Coniella lustricola]
MLWDPFFFLDNQGHRAIGHPKRLRQEAYVGIGSRNSEETQDSKNLWVCVPTEPAETRKIPRPRNAFASFCLICAYVSCFGLICLCVLFYVCWCYVCLYLDYHVAFVLCVGVMCACVDYCFYATCLCTCTYTLSRLECLVGILGVIWLGWFESSFSSSGKEWGLLFCCCKCYSRVANKTTQNKTKPLCSLPSFCWWRSFILFVCAWQVARQRGKETQGLLQCSTGPVQSRESERVLGCKERMSLPHG